LATFGEITTEGKRKQGRSAMAWIDDIKGWTGHGFAIAVKAAEHGDT